MALIRFRIIRYQTNTDSSAPYANMYLDIDNVDKLRYFDFSFMVSFIFLSINISLDTHYFVYEYCDWLIDWLVLTPT
jgi:hypothetical protein